MISVVRWENDGLVLLDQRLLPGKIEYVKCADFREVAHAIRDMVVRGAPAIGIAGAYGVALAAKESAGVSFLENAAREIKGPDLRRLICPGRLTGS